MTERRSGGKTRTRGSGAPGGRSRKAPASPAGRLRIVAGLWRSRVLEIADAPGLRPTPERVRETLFNWLAPRLPGARCLDLFAGSGALGLEALSRGAREAVLVENSPLALATLRRNVATLDADGARIESRDAYEYLEAVPAGRFDYVFLDPPFGTDRLADLCRLLDRGRILARGGRVYLELDRSRSLPDLPPGWIVHKNKTAGNVRYALVEPPAAGDGGPEEGE